MTATNFLETRRQRAEAERQERFGIYKTLIPKAAAGKLTEGDEAKLSDVIGQLQFDDAKVEADLSVVHKVRELSPVAATIPTKAAAVAKAEQALTAAQTDAEKIIAGIRAKETELVATARQARGALDDAEAAADAIAELRREKWELFGDEDPDVVGHRRHLIQSVFGTPTGTTAEVLEFELWMQSPTDRADLMDFDLLPAPGQSDAELTDLVDRIGKMTVTGQPTRYLLSVVDAGKAIQHRGVIVEVDSPAPFDLVKYHFTQAPGQSAEAFTDLLAGYRRRLRKEIRDRHGYGGDAIERIFDQCAPTVV